VNDVEGEAKPVSEAEADSVADYAGEAERAVEHTHEAEADDNGEAEREGESADEPRDPQRPESRPDRAPAEIDEHAFEPAVLEPLPLHHAPAGARPRRSLAIFFAVILLMGSIVGVLLAAGAFDDDATPLRSPVTQPAATTATAAPDTTEGDRSAAGSSAGADRAAQRRADARRGRVQGTATGRTQSWPEGRSAHTTVVYTSLTDRTTALSPARRAAALGLRAGVLRSDGFANLVPGVWVAFAGISDSPAAAQRIAQRIQRAAIAAEPYVRYVQSR